MRALLRPDDRLRVRDLGQGAHDATAGDLRGKNILGNVVSPGNRNSLALEQHNLSG